MISAEEASNKFMERVIVNVFQGVSEDIKRGLSNGLPGRVDDPIKTGEWFQGLSEDQKLIINEIINVSVKEAIFRFLVVLDNLTGGSPVTGEISDFALYLQTYISSEDKTKNRFAGAVRFNALTDNELHDLFLEALEN